jgi:3-oxosteroid 1-dehydrogenase
MVSAGRDDDFHRGDDAYGRFLGDPRVRPGKGNNGMASISRAPYYAVAHFPGDSGTLGGVVTDEHARVLREAGDSVIPRLYATGNITATVMGRAYPGGGASIAHTCTFGFIAMDHVKSLLDRVSR